MLKPQAALILALIAPAAAPHDPPPTPHHDTLDLHHLPLGDGGISTTPKPGYVLSCQTQFNPNAGGARSDVPWIHYDHQPSPTWDLTEKPQASGNITWPEAQFTITRTPTALDIQGNGLPVKTPTGNFPITPTDPVAAYDRNPNTIRKQTVALTLPADPQAAAQPSCVPMGMIGVALNGVAIFNALDGGGRDAVAHEVQDLCSGHPEPRGTYHYHGPSPCLPGETQPEQLIGYALDGFGIYSLYDAAGNEVTNAALDGCHGRTSTVLWNGKLQPIYHYVLTREYPYSIGCFTGTPQHLANQSRGPSNGPPGGPNGNPNFRRPPPPM